MTARQAQPWLLVAPMLSLVTAIVLLPELWALYLSFTDYSVGEAPRLVGAANYASLIGGGEFWAALLRTIGFVAIAVSLEMAVGIALACALHGHFRLKGIWIACLIAPVAMSQAVTASAWAYLLDPNTGPLNYVAAQLGLGHPQWLASTGSALVTVAVVEFWAGMPHVLIFLYPVRRALPAELYEAAAIDGAGRWAMFASVTWPLLRPAVLVALIFRLIITLRAFGTIWILTRGGPLQSTEILSVLLYKLGFRYSQFGAAAAVAWLMLLVTAAIAAGYVIRLYREGFGREA